MPCLRLAAAREELRLHAMTRRDFDRFRRVWHSTFKPFGWTRFGGFQNWQSLKMWRTLPKVWRRFACGVNHGVNDVSQRKQFWGAGRSRCSKARMAPFQKAVSCSFFRTSLQWFWFECFHIVFHLHCKKSITVLQCRWFDLQGTRSWKSGRNARRSLPWRLRFAYPKVEQIVECTSYILKFYKNAIMRPETKTRFLLQWRKPRCLVKGLESEN